VTDRPIDQAAMRQSQRKEGRFTEFAQDKGTNLLRSSLLRSRQEVERLKGILHRLKEPIATESVTLRKPVFY
jgi:hypothetical protein